MVRTLSWTGAINNDATVAGNWNDLTTPADPATSPPGQGDTAIVSFGTVLLPLDAQLSRNTIEVGGTAGTIATVVFAGDDGTAISAPTLDDATLIDNQVPGQTTAEQTVLDADGTFVNDGAIIADGPAGSVFTIDIAQNGTDPGFFINKGDIEADAGNTLDIVIGSTSAIYNAGYIVADAGTIRITTTGSDQIVGGYPTIIGLVAVENGGTVEFGATTAADASGPRQVFAFADGQSDLLKLDQVLQFSGNIIGFQQGDTIDLGQAFTVTSYTYNKYGILSLYDGTTLDASLDIPGPYDIGTFTVGTAPPGSFGFSTGSDGDTLVLTAAINDTWIANSGTNAWSTGANWGNGSPPGATGTAIIGGGSDQPFTVQTGSASVGSLVLSDANATLEVNGSFQVFPGSYDSTVDQIAGFIQIDSGDSASIYALRQFNADTELELLPGSSLLIAGRPSTALTNDGSIGLSPGGNNFALGIEGFATVRGATINAGPGRTNETGGAIYIGQDGDGAPAVFGVSSNGAEGAFVTDTYASIFSSSTSYGTLDISGANTVWDDAGDPTDTQNTRGAMLVGQNDQQDNAPAPPYVAAAQLTVEQDAILEEADYANIANTIDSAGSVVISTGAQWDIGNTGTTGTPIGFLQVGRYGDGALTIDEAGTVAVGGGGTIVNNGTTETINYAVDIGHEAGATGTLTLQDGGSVLTTLGALIDGDSGSGNVTVEFGAQAFIDGTIGLGGGGSGPAGGDGVLDVIHDGTIEQGAGFALAVWAGSTLAVDASSAFDAGGSGVFVAGAVQIDAAGSGLRGDGVVEANIVNDGSIHATNSGTYSASTGGLLDITGSVTGSGTSYVSPGATLEIAGTIAASQNVIFQTQTGTPETLILGTPGSGLASALSGLQNHDRIELAGLAITGATFNSGTITVATTGSPYLLTDVSFASGANHSLVTGHDSTTGNDYIQVTCFAAGTRIATPDGPVPVERLRVGQRVETALGGGARDIIWIGRRRIDCRRHPNPSQVWPIRLRAGAFGANQPVRDLFLSPDHAVHFQGALIPVQYLVNGTTVQQMPVDGITYYHVELATHDVLFAEDLPVESYLDTDDRATFDNGSGPVRLHPDLTILRWEALGCAPLTVTGPKVAAARARLAAVAAAAA